MLAEHSGSPLICLFNIMGLHWSACLTFLVIIDLLVEHALTNSFILSACAFFLDYLIMSELAMAYFLGILVKPFCFTIVLSLLMFSRSPCYPCVSQYLLQCCIQEIVRRAWAALNPLPAKLFNLNFHPLEVVSRWRDPQLQVSENYSDLTKWRSILFKSCWLMSHFIFNIFKKSGT